MAEKTGKQPKPKGPEAMAKLVREDGRYPLEAFEFLHDGLETAAQKVHGSGPAEPGQRHVTGPQLCHSLRDLAVQRWGPLAKTVLRRWHIRGTLDFGHMVYLLVNHDFMQKTPEDSVEDFRDVYDFDTAFRVKPEFKLKE
jgi:uncharacterized repeat protein (TIGR04138 family)